VLQKELSKRGIKLALKPSGRLFYESIRKINSIDNNPAMKVMKTIKSGCSDLIKALLSY
jgi:hypothetical protein